MGEVIDLQAEAKQRLVDYQSTINKVLPPDEKLQKAFDSVLPFRMQHRPGFIVGYVEPTPVNDPYSKPPPKAA